MKTWTIYYALENLKSDFVRASSVIPAPDNPAFLAFMDGSDDPIMYVRADLVASIKAE